MLNKFAFLPSVMNLKLNLPRSVPIFSADASLHQGHHDLLDCRFPTLAKSFCAQRFAHELTPSARESQHSVCSHASPKWVTVPFYWSKNMFKLEKRFRYHKSLNRSRYWNRWSVDSNTPPTCEAVKHDLESVNSLLAIIHLYIDNEALLEEFPFLAPSAFVT